MPLPDLLDHDGPRGRRRASRAVQRARPDGPVVSYATTTTRVAHVLLVALGWVVFGLLWLRVLGRPGAPEAVMGTLVRVGGLVLVVTAATATWIAHNVALARRRGGRRTGTTPLVVPEHDLLGRVLLVDPGACDASLVVVEVDEVGKTFSARSHDG